MLEFRTMARRCAVGWGAIGVHGCGPQVAVDDAGAGPNETAATATSSPTSDPPPSTPGSTTTPTPTTSTSTSTSTTDATSDDDAALDTSSFITMSDGPGTQRFECDLFFAPGCPRGEKCMGWSNNGAPYWNATRCSPIARDPAQPGEPCHVEDNAFSGIDDCDLGSMCLFVDDQTLQGECVAMCTGSADVPVCSVGEACLQHFGGAIAVCIPECQPLPDDCVLGTCLFAEGVASWLFGCFADGDALPPGATCYAHDCAPGAACLEPAITGECNGALPCCTSFCDLTAIDPTAACLPTQSCTPVTDVATPPAGYETLGLCTVNP